MGRVLQTFKITCADSPHLPCASVRAREVCQRRVARQPLLAPAV